MNATALKCSLRQRFHHRPAPMWGCFALRATPIQFRAIGHGTDYRIGVITSRLHNVAAKWIAPIDTTPTARAVKSP